MARNLVPRPRLDANSLRRHRAELRVIDRADILEPIAKRPARRGEERRHLKPAKIDLNVYHTRSSAAKTGPSMQQRELPRTVFWMQA